MPFSSQSRGTWARISSGETSSAMRTSLAAPRSICLVTSLVPLAILPVETLFSTLSRAWVASSCGVWNRTNIAIVVTSLGARNRAPHGSWVEAAQKRTRIKAFPCVGRQNDDSRWQDRVVGRQLSVVGQRQPEVDAL